MEEEKNIERRILPRPTRIGHIKKTKANRIGRIISTIYYKKLMVSKKR